MALSTPTRAYGTHIVTYERGFNGGVAETPPPIPDVALPVFDRGAAQKIEEPRRGSYTSKDLTAINKRDDKDRKPGTRVPFHEPDPDRLAKAEALRQSILAQEQRRWGNQERDPSKINRQPAHKPQANMSTLPDVPLDKVWPRYDCREESAAVSGERDGVVLFFESAVKAQTAMTGRTNNGKNIANAAAGITRGAYGWKWTRLRRSPTGPKSQPVRGRGGK